MDLIPLASVVNIWSGFIINIDGIDLVTGGDDEYFPEDSSKKILSQIEQHLRPVNGTIEKIK